ncbi:PTS glucitol/sorbitol transporter subunit IIA [Shouchella patagoniensis]|uniref:PTS glucitol/sorbitol transporter subunit IIA n=1 Tax=Shouchella patagoniensis TaxID=228576 RepID=UPI000994E5E9|nr:PTS glucitol/sorbitol transporter subunit IIA [Shouchella patagoniensis]
MIYKTTVTKMGPSAGDFLEENMIILFKDNAPEELAEFCVLHEENELNGEVVKGDTITIAGSSFKVTAVGEAVGKNLRALGHITIKADGAMEAELPGTLSVEANELPKIEAGHTITITR